MNVGGGEAADQLVRMMLSGTEMSLDALILGIEPDAAQESECRTYLKAAIVELIEQLAQLRAQL